MPHSAAFASSPSATLQLPPIVSDRRHNARLQDAFGGTFLFHAPAAHSMTMVELTEVFRQKDQRFVGILNEIREGDISDAALAELNARVGTVPREDDHRWVWLCTTNNRRCLDALPGEAHIYRAGVSGEFEALGCALQANAA